MVLGLGMPTVGGAAPAGAAWEVAWICAAASHSCCSREVEVTNGFLGEQSQAKLCDRAGRA